MMTDFVGGFILITIVLCIMIGICIGWAFSMFKDAQYEHKIVQCLSQSGTTWKGGECVIILNK